MTSLANTSPQYRTIPWSYSSLQSFETCPRRHHITKLAKLVKEPQTPALAWGNAVHGALEKAVLGTEGLGSRFKQYQPVVDKVLATPGQKIAERNFALTKSFKPTDYWASDAYVRGKADLTILREKSGILLDWKTGAKAKDDPSQLNLFAAVLLAEKPAFDYVYTGFVFLGADKIITKKVERAETAIIWQDFTRRVARLEHSAATDDWPPRPSGLCRAYCPVGKKLCEHCGS